MSIHPQVIEKEGKKKIGFVGVGRMGGNMARRLADGGYRVTAVYDVHRAGARALADELGCVAATKLSAVTAAADVVFTVVTDDAAMRRIYFGKSDNLLTGASGKIFINCATVSPGIHREIHRAALRRKAHVLEACMASSIPQARQGTLYLMVGGRPDAYRKVRRILEHLSASMRYIGAASKAAEVKAIVNMVMNMNTAALAEGLGLGHALGHDLDLLREVLSQTGANSRVLETDGPDMQNRDHECYFSAEHAAKDSGIAAALAREVKLRLPVNDATLAQYRRMAKEGLGRLDKSGVAELTFKGRHAHPARKRSIG